MNRRERSHIMDRLGQLNPLDMDLNPITYRSSRNSNGASSRGRSSSSEALQERYPDEIDVLYLNKKRNFMRGNSQYCEERRNRPNNRGNYRRGGGSGGRNHDSVTSYNDREGQHRNTTHPMQNRYSRGYYHERGGYHHNGRYFGGENRNMNSGYQNSQGLDSHLGFTTGNGFNIKNIFLSVSSSGERTVKAEYEPSLSSDDNDSVDTESVINFANQLVSLGMCRVCNKDSVKKCPHCPTTYCSSACASIDWKRHKPLCKGREEKHSKENIPQRKHYNQLSEVPSNRARNNHLSQVSHHSIVLEEAAHSTPHSHSRRNKNKNTDSRKLQPHSASDRESEGTSSCASLVDGKVTKAYPPSSVPSKVATNQVSPPSRVDSKVATNQVSPPSLVDSKVVTKHVSPPSRVSSKQTTHQISPSGVDRKITSDHVSMLRVDSKVTPNQVPPRQVDSKVATNQVCPPTSISNSKPAVKSDEHDKRPALPDSPESPTEDVSDLQDNFTSVETKRDTEKETDDDSCSTFEYSPNVAASAVGPLQSTLFTEVIVSYIEHEEETLWVIKAADSETKNEVSTQLQEFSTTGRLVTNVCVGRHCHALNKYNNLWSRGLVVSVDGTSVRIHFIDDGNSQVMDVSEMRALPKTLLYIQPLAFKVKFASKFSHKFLGLLPSEHLFIKPIEKLEDVCVVALLTVDEVSSIRRKRNKQKPPIPHNTFTQVIVTYVIKSPHYWVQKVADFDKVNDLLLSLLECGDEFRRLRSSDIKVGAMCLVLFDKLWYRAKIKSLGKIEVTVELIDYGNEVNCCPKSLKQLPAEYASIPPYGFKIELMSSFSDDVDEPLKCDDKISVKLLSKVGDVWLVQKDKEEFLPSHCIDPSDMTDEEIDFNCIFEEPVDEEPPETLYDSEGSGSETKKHQTTSNSTLPQPLKVKICHIEEDLVYWVQKSGSNTMNLLLTLVNDKSKTAAQVDPSALKPGSIFAVLFHGLWYRGKIMSITGGIRVRYIDYGNEEICSPEEIRELSSIYTRVPPYAFKIYLKPEMSERYSFLKIDDEITIEPIAKHEKDTEGLWVKVQYRADMLSSEPSAEQPDNHFTTYPLPLNSYSKVMITHVMNSGRYWVTKVSDLELSFNLVRELQPHCEEAPYFSISELTVGLLCAAYNGLWYRAEILSLTPAIKVRFVDSGKEKICPPSHLKKISPEMASIQPYAIKIELAVGTREVYYGLLEQETLSVKPICLDEDVWSVHVENKGSEVSGGMETDDQLSQSRHQIQPHIKGVLKQAPPTPKLCFTTVVVSHIVEKNVYWVYKKSDSKKLHDIEHELKAHLSSPDCTVLKNPSRGDMVTILHENQWHRGKVLSTTPEISVRLIDKGDEGVIPESELKSLPAKLITLPPLAFKIKLSAGTSHRHTGLPLKSEMSVCPVAQNEECWIVRVENMKPGCKTVTFREDVIIFNETVKPKTTLPPVLLPIDEFTDVLVAQAIDSRTYWVNKGSELPMAVRLVNDLKRLCNSPRVRPIMCPAKGDICCVYHMKEWNRALIIDVGEETVLVNLFDFGKEVEVALFDIVTLPDKLSSIPQLSIKIRLTEDTPDEFLNLSSTDSFSIKPLKLVDELWIVEARSIVIEENDIHDTGNFTQEVPSQSSHPIVSSIPPYHKPPATVDSSLLEPTLRADDFIRVMVLSQEFNYYWVMNYALRNSAKEMFDTMNQQCSSSSVPYLTSVSIGMKCAVNYQSKWYRAQVKEEKPIIVKFVDHGVLAEVPLSDIKQLPPPLDKFKPLAFKIKIVEDESTTEYRDLPVFTKIDVILKSMDFGGVWLVSVGENGVEGKSGFDCEDRYLVLSPHQLGFDHRNHHPALPFNDYSEVIPVLENDVGDYWVNLNSSLNALLSLTEKLAMLEKPVVRPELGKIYNYLYVDTWCRAKVIKLEPLTIHYIDFGNKEVITNTQLYPLPHELTIIPPYAFRIKMFLGTSDKYMNIELNSIVSVRPLYKTIEGVYFVQIKDEDAPQLSVPRVMMPNISGATLGNLLSTAVELGKCSLLVSRKYNNKTFSCFLDLDLYVKRSDWMKEQLQLLESPHQFIGKVGSIVGCKSRDGVYGRGYVLSTKTQSAAGRVAMIDFGFTCDVVSMWQLPLQIQQLPASAVTLRFEAPMSKIQVNSSIRCCNVESLGNLVACEAEEFGFCTLSVWEMFDELPALPCQILGPKCSVVITSVTESCNTLYVQPLTQENLDNIDQVNSNILSVTMRGSSLQSPPSRGDLVLCHLSEDNLYHRAQVFDTVADQFHVTFIDFGESVQVRLSDLKTLPDNIKELPVCAIRVVLENVNPRGLVPELKTYLEKFIQESTVFSMTFDDINSVILKQKNGEILNNCINKITGFSPDPPGARLMFDAGRCVEWEVGDKLEVIVLEKLPSNMLMVINRLDLENTVMLNKLTHQLGQHALTFPPAYTYKPHLYELVIARFDEDGLWYRALCQEQLSNATFRVHFLDYGNYSLVGSEDVRPLSSKFLETPLIVRKCQIHGLPKEVKGDVEAALNEMYSEGTILSVTVSGKCADFHTLFHQKLADSVNKNLIALPSISVPPNL